MTKARKTNLFFLWMIVFYLIACFLIIPLIPREKWSYNMNIIAGQSLIFIPLLVYIICTKGKALQEIRFKRIGVLNTVLLILFTYCMIPVVSLINVITMMFTTNAVSDQLDNMSGSNSFLLNIFLVAMLPAMLEEITFRGVIYTGYRNSTLKRGMFASALMFGLIHMNINQFCYAFFMGIIFVLLREATGSTHASMIVHFIFNANSIVLLKIIEIYKNYVNKMAKTDETFKDIANQINESSSATTSIADYSIGQKLYTIFSLGIVAVIAAVIGILIFSLIASRCHRSRHVKLMLASITGRPLRNRRFGREDEYVENNQGEYGGKIVDFVFILAVVLCVLMMIYTM